jgi:thiamine pyrophosphate-dependent acetolactate synthase large subunit-like protein
MNSQEVETATRLGLNLVVLIVTDSAFGMIRWKQEGQGLDDFGLEYNNREFIIKPPSPQTAITCRCGYNKAQAIALDNPAPIVAKALSSKTVLGI